MVRVGRMQVGDHVKKWSYSKIEKVFGDQAEAVATACGVKKTSKKDKKED